MLIMGRFWVDVVVYFVWRLTIVASPEENVPVLLVMMIIIRT